ncbi:MAG: hypothetical protein AAFU85_34500, partial [Planctomycetota bacterium]
MNSNEPNAYQPSLRCFLLTLCIATSLALFSGGVTACPFCTALQPTLSDDLAQATAVVIARCDSSS